MIVSFLCLLISTTLLPVSAAPVAQLPSLEGDEANTILSGSSPVEQTVTLSPQDQDSPSPNDLEATSNKSGQDPKKQESPPILSLDDYLYDYDYLNLFYDLDILETTPTTKEVTSSNREQTPPSIIATTTKSEKKQKISSTIDPDTILRYKDSNKFEQEVRKQTSNLVGEEQPKRTAPSVSLKPFAKQIEDNLIPDKNKKTANVQPVVVTTTTTTEPATTTDQMEGVIKISNTTSISASVPETRLANGVFQSHPKNDSKSAWTSSRSSVSFEVRVESSYPKQNRVSSSVSSSSANQQNIFLLKKDRESNQEKMTSNNQMRNPLVLEVSATPKTIGLDISNGKDNVAKTLFNGQPQSKTTSQSPSTSYPDTEIPATEPSVTATEVTTESLISTTNKSFVTSTTTEATTTTAKIEDPIQSRRPFAFLRRGDAGLDRTRNLPPPILKKSRNSSFIPRLNKEVSINSNNKQGASLADKNEPQLVAKTLLSDPVQENVPINEPSAMALKRVPKRRKSRRRKPSPKRRPSVPLAFRSQLGSNPHGQNPGGFTPFGRNPLGSAPFGFSPQGAAPLGANLLRNSSTNATLPAALNTTSTATQNGTDVTEERYHVQVKKPDGSINGDYIVINPNSGSLSGVRYEAIVGADQALIQQALLSFLSLDQGIELATRQQKSLDAEIASSLSKHTHHPRQTKSTKPKLNDQT